MGGAVSRTAAGAREEMEEVRAEQRDRQRGGGGQDERAAHAPRAPLGACGHGDTGAAVLPVRGGRVSGIRRILRGRGVRGVHRRPERAWRWLLLRPVRRCRERHRARIRARIPPCWARSPPPPVRGRAVRRPVCRPARRSGPAASPRSRCPRLSAVPRSVRAQAAPRRPSPDTPRRVPATRRSAVQFGFLVDDLVEQRRRTSPGKGASPVAAYASTAPSEKTSEADRTLLAQDLLRRHIAGRADRDSGGSERCGAVGGTGDTEVDQPRSVRREQHIGRFDVAVHQPQPVHMAPAPARDRRPAPVRTSPAAGRARRPPAASDGPATYPVATHGDGHPGRRPARERSTLRAPGLRGAGRRASRTPPRGGSARGTARRRRSAGARP